MHETKKVLDSLNRIEGQIRGIKNMLNEERNCADILVQLSAVNSAISSVAKNVLNEHLKHCVVDGIEKGEADKTIDELISLLESYFKMKK